MDNDRIQKRPLLKKDSESIIKTNYGLKEIPPCFGFIHKKIVDPNEIPTGVYSTPDELLLVKKTYTYLVRESVNEASTCSKCHMFDKCTKLSLVMQERERE